MAPAASQRTGGRLVTTGATRETSNKRKTDGEEVIGGERDARVGQVTGDTYFGRGNLGRGGVLRGLEP